MLLTWAEGFCGPGHSCQAITVISRVRQKNSRLMDTLVPKTLFLAHLAMLCAPTP